MKTIHIYLFTYFQDIKNLIIELEEQFFTKDLIIELEKHFFKIQRSIGGSFILII